MNRLLNVAEQFFLPKSEEKARFSPYRSICRQALKANAKAAFLKREGWNTPCSKAKPGPPAESVGQSVSGNVRAAFTDKLAFREESATYNRSLYIIVFVRTACIPEFLSFHPQSGSRGSIQNALPKMPIRSSVAEDGVSEVRNCLLEVQAAGRCSRDSRGRRKTARRGSACKPG